MGWQPVETAPKDGTRVLMVKLGFQVCIGYWLINHGLWATTDPEDYPDEETWEAEQLGSRYYPTHWMPLPEPPSNAAINGAPSASD